jgi:hypothetical protein
MEDGKRRTEKGSLFKTYFFLDTDSVHTIVQTLCIAPQRTNPFDTNSGKLILISPPHN